MPFRAKMKRALGGGNGGATEYDPSNPLTHIPSKRSRKDDRDYPENVYKPGEVMPRPKYRGPYNQAHQDKLSAFSFGDAWKKRKNSTGTEKSAKGGSEYSPMGSRLPSRGPSRRGSAWSAFSGKGGGRRAVGDRQGSHSGYDGYNGRGGGARVEESGEGDDDVVNVGLTRQSTASPKPPPPPPKDDVFQMNGLRRQKTIKNGYMDSDQDGYKGLQPLDTQRTITNGQLFTADELASAMSQSTLKASTRET
ncbi:MAG: hypothetical protein Q9164_000163 [Protoblastenia rupestris]